MSNHPAGHLAAAGTDQCGGDGQNGTIGWWNNLSGGLVVANPNASRESCASRAIGWGSEWGGGTLTWGLNTII